MYSQFFQPILRTYLSPHNFTPSLLTPSLKTLFKIFPLGVFGIASKNLTPPSNLLYPANLPSIHRKISSSFTSFCEPDFRTMYARGHSVSLEGEGMPITAASTILGWDRRTPSSSAGETWKARTLINSFISNYCQ